MSSHSNISMYSTISRTNFLRVAWNRTYQPQEMRRNGSILHCILFDKLRIHVSWIFLDFSHGSDSRKSSPLKLFHYLFGLLFLIILHYFKGNSILTFCLTFILHYLCFQLCEARCCFGEWTEGVYWLATSKFFWLGSFNLPILFQVFFLQLLIKTCLFLNPGNGSWFVMNSLEFFAWRRWLLLTMFLNLRWIILMIGNYFIVLPTFKSMYHIF